MICKNCGNVIHEGSYCLRCGTENDETKNESIIDEIDKDMSKTNYRQGTAKFVVKWGIFIIILWIVVGIMNLSFNSCVANKGGPSNCGLGSLCDHECMPPFFMITNFMAITLTFISILLSPMYLLQIIRENRINKKNNK